MATTLKWESFEPLFGTYSNRFKKFFDDGGFDPIYERLKFDSLRGKRVAPLSTNVFRCFQETPIDEIKVVLVGYCPYYTFAGWSDKFSPNTDINKPSKIYPVADGLALSCSVTKRLQPSLEQFYNALFLEFGVEGIKDPDLLYLAKQGVLLLNSALTTEEGKPGSHSEIWNPFMQYLFEEVLTTNGIPIILLGKEAQKLKRYIMPFTWIFELPHPTSSAYNNSQWCSDQVFTNCNKILKDNNNTTINWVKTE